MTREIKGYHVALIFGSAFTIIIGVNMVLAVQAVRTFPGLEVKNSYVASQSFNRDKVAQEALGWTAEAAISDDTLRLTLTGPDGRPADATINEARVGRASHVAEDRVLDLHRNGAVWTAPLPDLNDGVWHLWLDARAGDGTKFRQRLDLWAAR